MRQSAPALGPPSEERGIVAVLFAGVTGSTALGEAEDPGDLRERLAPWARDRGLESLERTADLLAATVGAGESEVASSRTSCSLAATRRS